MAPSVPTREPASFVAGSTLRFDIEPGEYPPGDSWILTYYLHPGAAGTVISFASTDVGGNHRINVDEATTAGWAAGRYRYKVHVADGTDVFEIRAGVMEILADPSAGTAVDYREHPEIVLEALEALIEGKALRGDQTSFSIAGRQITRMTPEEIRGWRDDYAAQVAKIRAEDRKRRGLGNFRKIRTRFPS